MCDEGPKAEFFANNGIIEIRYFDEPKDKSCRSWKLPESIADEVTAWWAMARKGKKLLFPIQIRAKKCEFTMYSEKYIEIKSLDCQGRTNMTGWSLPAATVECLSMRQKIAK